MRAGGGEGKRIGDRGARDGDRGARDEGRGARIGDRGTRDEGRGTWILELGTWSLDEVEDRGADGPVRRALALRLRRRGSRSGDRGAGGEGRRGEGTRNEGLRAWGLELRAWSLELGAWRDDGRGSWRGRPRPLVRGRPARRVLALRLRRRGSRIEEQGSRSGEARGRGTRGLELGTGAAFRSGPLTPSPLDPRSSPVTVRECRGSSRNARLPSRSARV
jgi:hypothetical protein